MTKARPPMPDELLALSRRLRLPYLRAHAPEVIATAKAQRWDPAEVLRVLLAEEAKGRDAATRRCVGARRPFPRARLLTRGVKGTRRSRFRFSARL